MASGPTIALLAYLDPGTGSQLLQIALATLLAASFTLKLYWRRFRAFLAGDKRKDAAERERGDGGQAG